MFHRPTSISCLIPTPFPMLFDVVPIHDAVNELDILEFVEPQGSGRGVLQGFHSTISGGARYDASLRHAYANRVMALAKDDISLPRFKSSQSELSFDNAIIDITSYFDATLCPGPDSWRRWCVSLHTTISPHRHSAATWFRSLNRTLTSYDQFLSEIINHFICDGTDLLTLKERWCSVRQRLHNSVNSFYEHADKLHSHIHSLGDNITTDVFFDAFMFGFQPPRLENVRAQVFKVQMRSFPNSP